MSDSPMTSVSRRFWPPRPWHVLLVGLGVTLLGLLGATLGDNFAGLRFVLFLVGLVTAGAAVSMRLRRAGWAAFEDRMETAGMLAVAAFAALLALLNYMSVDTAWDSMEMVLVALILAALAGVVLVLLPTTARMIVGGLLVVVHFLGILSAATAIDPPNSAAPWVARVAHQYVYRPYVEFMYLNNAYHFYSPEPGPPSLLWFHVKYENGKVKWVKIPHRDDDPVPIHHVRLLSITESSAALEQLQLRADYETATYIKYQRNKWGELFDIKEAPEFIMPVPSQEQETQPFSQKMIESYVRHIAFTHPSLGEAPNGVKSIKVYRLRHGIILPQAMAEGRDPRDKTLFVGYYQGEYDKDGNLLYPDTYTLDGNPNSPSVPYDYPGAKLAKREDAFRFWYMPVYYRPKDHSKPVVTPEMRPQDLELVDCLTRHAWFDLGQKKVIEDPADSPWDVETELDQP
jgi:hypothetical protein